MVKMDRVNTADHRLGITNENEKIVLANERSDWRQSDHSELRIDLKCLQSESYAKLET